MYLKSASPCIPLNQEWVGNLSYLAYWKDSSLQFCSYESVGAASKIRRWDEMESSQMREHHKDWGEAALCFSCSFLLLKSTSCLSVRKTGEALQLGTTPCADCVGHHSITQSDGGCLAQLVPVTTCAKCGNGYQGTSPTFGSNRFSNLSIAIGFTH